MKKMILIFILVTTFTVLYCQNETVYDNSENSTEIPTPPLYSTNVENVVGTVIAKPVYEGCPSYSVKLVYNSGLMDMPEYTIEVIGDVSEELVDYNMQWISAKGIIYCISDCGDFICEGRDEDYVCGDHFLLESYEITTICKSVKLIKQDDRYFLQSDDINYQVMSENEENFSLQEILAYLDELFDEDTSGERCICAYYTENANSEPAAYIDRTMFPWDSGDSMMQYSCEGIVDRF